MDHFVHCPLSVASNISHAVVYTQDPCSPPYSPFGFCDYSVLDMMPVAMPVAHAVASSPPSVIDDGVGAMAYTELTELHSFMDNVPYRTSADETFELTVGSLGPDEDPDSEQSEQQAVLRRMVCSEPVIIQENDRICVVRESGPLRTFTAM